MRAYAPATATDPASLDRDGRDWYESETPGTVASILRRHGAWSLDGPTRRFDAEDWWYRATFELPVIPHDESWVLCLEGLATLADVWIDGQLRLQSTNMFARAELPLAHYGPGAHEIAIRFHSLDDFLKKRRGRPRWRAPMIESQQLRWARTTVLGRTPGWSPPAAAVGPWKPICIERRSGLAVRDLRLNTQLHGGDGIVSAKCKLEALGAGAIAGATLVVTCTQSGTARAIEMSGSTEVSAELRISAPRLWWPHTHGTPALYRAHLEVRIEGGAGPAIVELGDIGFRTVHLTRDEGDFTLHINGTPIFCRGACWTPLDPIAFCVDETEYRRTLQLAVDAGFNMLRVSGTMVYEDPVFLDLCNRMGVLVWHDLMFANMDYPGDADFLSCVENEVRQQLSRWQAHPCMAVVCGNSEVGQQASMWGAGRDLWVPDLFTKQLTELVRELCPAAAYVPSSTHGGSFPHQVDSGVCSYYGVGAYLRPIEDARRSEVRFASECLAFANVPERQTVNALGGATALKTHHPRWKERVPRDLGAGWDFEDVRDHYLQLLFGADPVRLRSTDHERYLELSRVVTGEVMSATFAEWRRKRSRCRGALIWFLKDLWPGAGWGVVDANGHPKAAYYYLKRALQPVFVSLSDEGCNGLFFHLGNEHAQAFGCRVEIAVYRSATRIAQAQRELEIPAAGSIELPVLSLFDHFMDLSYAYRFGPPAQDLVVASLFDARNALRSQAFYFCNGLPNTMTDIGLTATARRVSPTQMQVTIACDKLAQSVRIDTDHGRAADQYFHVAPRSSRDVVIDIDSSLATNSFSGTVTALNCAAARRIEVDA